MTREKALEILRLNIKDAGKAMPPDVKTALEMAISDIFYCQQIHRFPHLADTLPLPGETER